MSLHLTPPDEAEVEAVEGLLPALHVSQEVAVATEPPQAPEVMADPVMALAVAISRLPGIDKEMFREIMAQQAAERIAQAEERYNDAMNLCQREIEPVARTSENKQTHSWWAKLEAVDAAIRPVYLRYGFNVSYNTVPPLTAGNIRVECEVALGRFSKKYYREAPPDTVGPQGKAVKTVLHGTGSTETFLKRYAVCSAFNVVFKNLDDDGVKGGWVSVTEEQVEQLVELLKESGQHESRFLMRMASDANGEPVKKFEDLGHHDFGRVANTLKLMADRKKGQTDAESDSGQ